MWHANSHGYNPDGCPAASPVTSFLAGINIKILTLLNHENYPNSLYRHFIVLFYNARLQEISCGRAAEAGVHQTADQLGRSHNNADGFYL